VRIAVNPSREPENEKGIEKRRRKKVGLVILRKGRRSEALME
jgi:hypothetical protein